MLDKIFWMIGKKHNINTWWEIFDSELFNEVCEEIARTYGITWNNDDDLFDKLCDEVKGFSEWNKEMAEEL